MFHFFCRRKVLAQDMYAAPPAYSWPLKDPLQQRSHLTCAVLRLQVLHAVSENTAIAFATSRVAPVVVDPLEYSVEVCLDFLAEIPI